MLVVNKDTIIFNYRFCQQCGACYAICPTKAINLKSLENGLQKIEVNQEICITCKKCVSVCPANRIIIKSDYLGSLKEKGFFLSYNNDKRIRRDSSSGGVCKTLIIDSLNNNIVDAVYSLKKLDTYPSAEGEFYTRQNLPSYDEIPNSIYHSIMLCKEIGKVRKVRRLMIVGTSCQLYALEKSLKGKYEEIIKVCIFCKQQKTLESTKWFAKVMGVKLPEKQEISTCYRGEGWPGNLRVMEAQLPWNKAAGLPFGRRLWSVPGCDICADPFGLDVGADVTLMDPWTIRKKNELGETLVISHTKKGEELLIRVPSLTSVPYEYGEVKPALGEIDVWRKRQLVCFFKGEDVPQIIKKAGKAEMRQREFFEKFLEFMPKLPFCLYRLLNKIVPKRRDKILKNNQL